MLARIAAMMARDFAMNGIKPKKNIFAGGIFVALGLLIGTTTGILKGQPSLGAVIGLGAGGALALLVWVADHFRK
jgi:hypothetical protein